MGSDEELVPGRQGARFEVTEETHSHISVALSAAGQTTPLRLILEVTLRLFPLVQK